jgi:hypothetical protein
MNLIATPRRAACAPVLLLLASLAAGQSTWYGT